MTRNRDRARKEGGRVTTRQAGTKVGTMNSYIVMKMDVAKFKLQIQLKLTIKLT